MERKLATIEKILELHPIEGADVIERAVIRGWNVVVKKGQFEVGHWCIYCEIDSVMPKKPEFEFLAPRNYRIKTTKLRGQISQGIAFDLSKLPIKTSIIQTPDGPAIEFEPYSGFIDLVQGLDVTKILDITKYEAPIPACLIGISDGDFPSHSIKTDEERCQNFSEETYHNYRNNYTWTKTEKLDGTSCTYTIYDDKFGVATRNTSLLENEENSLWKFARANDIEDKMRNFMKEHKMTAFTLQGELIGEGIQGNLYKIRGQEVRFFRAFDPITYLFVSTSQFILMMKMMDLKTVPILETELTLPDTVEELISMADGKSALFDTTREGIVFVADKIINTEARRLESYQNRLSFKVISNKFILKHDI